MRKNAMKVVALCLALSMMFIIVSGCQKAGNGTSGNNTTQEQKTPEETKKTKTSDSSESKKPTNDWEIDKTPVELKIFMNSPENPDGEFSNFWGKNPVTKKITEDTGVTPVVTYAPDDTGQRLNMLIAAGDLPDIIMRAKLDHLRQMINSSMIWDLSELAKEAAPNFISLVPKHILLNERLTLDTMGYYVTSQGGARLEIVEKYGLPKSPWGPTIVKEIYEELGSPVVKTGEDYIKLMKAAIEKHPDMILHSCRYGGPNSTDGDGNPLAVVVSLAYGGLQRFYFENGKIIQYFEKPEFVNVLKFVNRLYKEKILWPDEFVGDDQIRRSNLDAGKVLGEMSEDFDNLVYFSSRLKANRPEYNNFIMLEPFSINEGKVPVMEANTFVGSIESGSCISKSSKNATRAIRFLEYMYFNPQTQKEIIFGLEGVHHDMVNGEPIIREEFKKSYIDDPIATRQKTGIHYVYLFRNDEWQSRMYEQIFGVTDYAKDALVKANKYAVDLSEFRGINQYPRDSEEAKIFASIKEYYSGKIVEVITGPADKVESSYKTLLNEMHKMGLDKLYDYMTKAYNARKAKVEKYKP